jgi:hypothetical protein
MTQPSDDLFTHLARSLPTPVQAPACAGRHATTVEQARKPQSDLWPGFFTSFILR